MSLTIRDAVGKMPVAEMRRHFEKMIEDTPHLKTNTPIGIMEINGRFDHYMNAETDTLWIGFALGMRCSERIKKGILPII